VACAAVAAADKSVIAARGKPWHRGSRQRGCVPAGVDPQAAWGRSEYHGGWVYGYCYEVLLCATKGSRVFPLLASADVASRSEHRSFPEKIPQFPRSLGNLLIDTGYDDNDMAEAVEWRPERQPRPRRQRRRRRPARPRRTGRRYLCPLQARGGKPAVGQTTQRGKRERSRLRRAARQRFFKSARGRRLYKRRKITCEPFNQWFKQLFELHQGAWHRGLDNNRTQLLAAIFGYQLLLRYNSRCGRRDGQVQWLLDGL
jgi:hypothetical protein